uniref:Uncharacterized protein n=1 Tax=Wildemania schizophylla TaxID=1134705 RepID=A0A126G1F3_WILSC|nr:hypothetical protein [Wildemania schizophylla]AKS28382.1 hypothetical protein [Wildemania schizophylla]
MTTFQLIPYRLYLSQSTTWMHSIKSEIKVYIVAICWISIFVLSCYKLLIIVFSLIMIGISIQNNQIFIKKQLLQTVLMTVVTALFSLSIASSYKSCYQQHQVEYAFSGQQVTHSFKDNKKDIHCADSLQTRKLFLIAKTSVCFFITVYSIKLVMITTSPEILVVALHTNCAINKFVKHELLFIFLLSSHIVTSVVVKLEKITQVTSSRGQLQLYKYLMICMKLSFLISKFFFAEIIRESRDISQALYSRNLNQESNNYLKIYTTQYNSQDVLGLIISTVYFLILLLI